MIWSFLLHNNVEGYCGLDCLNEIANNAREWYLRNITSPNITNIILNALEL
jgi:hypothetical protein